MSGTQTDHSLHTEPLSYTVPVAARLLGVCRATIYNRIRDGDLDSVKLGGRRLIPARNLRALIEGEAA